MSPPTRRRLSSTGDSSAPPSESSEGGSDHGDTRGDHQGQLMHNNCGGGVQMRHQIALDSPVQEEQQFWVADESALLQQQCQSAADGILQEYERQQIESFFSGLGTQVYVASSLANLYSTTSTSSSGGCGEWSLRYTGVPVLLHDAGICRSRSEPRVQLLLAERGTCFTLWRDTVDHLSDYRAAGQAFHTMCLGSDHRVLVGLSFDSVAAAKETWSRVERLVSDPENIKLNAPGRKKNKKKNSKNSATNGSRKQLQHLEIPKKPASKSQISIPCQFQHVTSVTVADRDRYFSLQALVGPADLSAAR